MVALLNGFCYTMDPFNDANIEHVHSIFHRVLRLVSQKAFCQSNYFRLYEFFIFRHFAFLSCILVLGTCNAERVHHIFFGKYTIFYRAKCIYCIFFFLINESPSSRIFRSPMEYQFSRFQPEMAMQHLRVYCAHFIRIAKWRFRFSISAMLYKLCIQSPCTQYMDWNLCVCVCVLCISFSILVGIVTFYTEQDSIVQTYRVLRRPTEVPLNEKAQRFISVS